jgi:arginyl-tRNA--protein-N-Asp/Glu arginylyltransferase
MPKIVIQEHFKKEAKMNTFERKLVEEMGLMKKKEIIDTWKLIYEVNRNKAGNKYQEAVKEFAEFLQRVAGNYIQEQFGKNKVANRLLAVAFNDVDFEEIARELVISSLFDGELR